MFWWALCHRQRGEVVEKGEACLRSPVEEVAQIEGTVQIEVVDRSYDEEEVH